MYATPRGIQRRAMNESVSRKRKLRGTAKHRDDMDALKFAKQSKVRGLFEKLKARFSGKKDAPNV